MWITSPNLKYTLTQKQRFRLSPPAHPNTANTAAFESGMMVVWEEVMMVIHTAAFESGVEVGVKSDDSHSQCGSAAHEEPDIAHY